MFFYRSDDLDDFAQFATGQPHQNGGGISPDGIEHDYGYEDDEMDFTPQNGYIPDEPEFVPYHEEEPKPAPETKAPKERYDLSILCSTAFILNVLPCFYQMRYKMYILIKPSFLEKVESL